MALTKNDLKQISLEITNALKKQKGEIQSSLAAALNRQKIEFTEALKEQKKEIVVELAEFLEKYVMEPIFGLKKDVVGLKKDVKEIKHTLEMTNRRIDTVLERDDRQDEIIENHENRIRRLEQPPMSPT